MAATQLCSAGHSVAHKPYQLHGSIHHCRLVNCNKIHFWRSEPPHFVITLFIRCCCFSTLECLVIKVHINVAPDLFFFQDLAGIGQANLAGAGTRLLRRHISLHFASAVVLSETESQY